MTDEKLIRKRYEELFNRCEDLHAQLQSSDSARAALGDALDKLKAGAQAVVDARDSPLLQDYITDLEEDIPCDDCLCAPCKCPD